MCIRDSSYSIANSILVNHPDRMTVYKNSDYQGVQKTMINFAGDIINLLGFFPVISDMPILTDLQTLSMGAMFLGIILNLVVILLAAISSYLVYSLLMISFETRMFEIGIFRLMGLTKFGLCVLILVQAMLFVLPALVVGIGSSFGILNYLSTLFEGSLGVSFSSIPSSTSFIWAFCVGFLVPIVASALPMQIILSKQLNQCLDTTHNKMQGVHITVEFAEDNLNWGFISFGIVTVVFGLCVYYLLPLSLLSMNFNLMLWLMLSILLALIICLLYTSPSPRDLSTSRMPSSA
eukprot:TRINITY_DN16473_c0_g1_i1.p1 TRINITY_DN16473_c0_g1~~TRINITY_DN16473_c0_g1_i1.p1  ORF type:complete len:292 (+),score=39.14 TRINITY_DN16473_c0_g1_i1:64-939(+)